MPKRLAPWRTHSAAHLALGRQRWLRLCRLLFSGPRAIDGATSLKEQRRRVAPLRGLGCSIGNRRIAGRGDSALCDGVRRHPAEGWKRTPLPVSLRVKPMYACEAAS